MKHLPLPSIEYINECFSYMEGSLIWRNRPVCHFLIKGNWIQFNRKFAGKIAGSMRTRTRGSVTESRMVVGINSISYPVSRIVWFIHTGIDTKFDIDHKDGNPLNDKIENLRECTNSLNHQNRRLRSDNRTGFKGVSKKIQKGKYEYYIARIMVNGKRIRVGGYHKTPEAAYNAYCEAARKYFGEFARLK